MTVERRSFGGDTDRAVRARYSAAALEKEAALCCPVDYDPQYLKLIPQEVLERDYGCGDPSRYVREGDVVLDLGSGAGKICFIAAQIVGPKGAVIGVDGNAEMLGLARESAPQVAEALGHAKPIGIAKWQQNRKTGGDEDLPMDPRAARATRCPLPFAGPLSLPVPLGGRSSGRGGSLARLGRTPGPSNAPAHRGPQDRSRRPAASRR